MLLEQSIGIDFRENTLRIVRLGRGLRRISLIDFLIKKYPFSLDKATSPENLDKIVYDINEFARKNGKPDYVVLCIPGQKVTIRTLSLPGITIFFEDAIFSTSISQNKFRIDAHIKKKKGEE